MSAWSGLLFGDPLYATDFGGVECEAVFDDDGYALAGDMRLFQPGEPYATPFGCVVQ